MARLLLVDDTPENLVQLSAALNGYEIVTAESGAEALRLAGEIPPVDLILLDVSLPDTDGYQLCAALKALPTWSNVPVIFVTGPSSCEEEELGLRAGAVDSIARPFHPERLRARVANHVELQRHRDVQSSRAVEHHWQIPNKLPELTSFQQRLRDCLREAGCSEDSIHDLELATEELLVNTIQYGFEDGQQAAIHVSIWAQPEQVKIQLRDTGKEFDPLQAEERPDDKVGGWGIPLIHHLMDEFHYQRVNDSNQVTLLRRQRDS
jgi:CheY-like chemotaxis protein/anti-sigma regulatory factor (Ser/Thr protein kinase)